jgi:hypothetical protein
MWYKLHPANILKGWAHIEQVEFSTCTGFCNEIWALKLIIGVRRVRPLLQNSAIFLPVKPL